MRFLNKLTIPAIVLTIISGDICLGKNEHGQGDASDSLFREATAIMHEYFLPHTFWQQNTDVIINYLKPQILETKAYEYYDYFTKSFIKRQLRPWTGEENFKEIIYKRISAFMEDKDERMPSIEDFEASFENHIALGSQYYGNSNLMTFLKWPLMSIAFAEYQKEHPGEEP